MKRLYTIIHKDKKMTNKTDNSNELEVNVHQDKNILIYIIFIISNIFLTSSNLFNVFNLINTDSLQ